MSDMGVFSFIPGKTKSVQDAPKDGAFEGCEDLRGQRDEVWTAADGVCAVNTRNIAVFESS